MAKMNPKKKINSGFLKNEVILEYVLPLLVNTTF